MARTPMTANADEAVAAILASPRVAYAHVRKTEAGCFIARIERA